MPPNQSNPTNYWEESDRSCLPERFQQIKIGSIIGSGGSKNVYDISYFDLKSNKQFNQVLLISLDDQENRREFVILKYLETIKTSYKPTTYFATICPISKKIFIVQEKYFHSLLSIGSDKAMQIFQNNIPSIGQQILVYSRMQLITMFVALQEFYAQTGIIHGDLHINNILFDLQGTTLVPIFTDFGLSGAFEGPLVTKMSPNNSPREGFNLNFYKCGTYSMVNTGPIVGLTNKDDFRWYNLWQMEIALKYQYTFVYNEDKPFLLKLFQSIEQLNYPAIHIPPETRQRLDNRCKLIKEIQNPTKGAKINEELFKYIKANNILIDFTA